MKGSVLVATQELAAANHATAARLVREYFAEQLLLEGPSVFARLGTHTAGGSSGSSGLDPAAVDAVVAGVTNRHVDEMARSAAPKVVIYKSEFHSGDDDSVTGDETEILIIPDEPTSPTPTDDAQPTSQPGSGGRSTHQLLPVSR